MYALLLAALCPCFSFAPQMAKPQYPTLFEITMDYLPIQASAVPCEWAFSSRAETLTACRNCIKPALMEALQMLKFTLKKWHLNFTENLLTSEHLMDDKEDDNDPQNSWWTCTKVRQQEKVSRISFHHPMNADAVGWLL